MQRLGIRNSTAIKITDRIFRNVSYLAIGAVLIQALMCTMYSVLLSPMGERCPWLRMPAHVGTIMRIGPGNVRIEVAIVDGTAELNQPDCEPDAANSLGCAN